MFIDYRLEEDSSAPAHYSFCY